MVEANAELLSKANCDISFVLFVGTEQLNDGKTLSGMARSLERFEDAVELCLLGRGERGVIAVLYWGDQ